MKAPSFWFGLVIAAQVTVMAAAVLGAWLGFALMTHLAPFRYMEY